MFASTSCNKLKFYSYLIQFHFWFTANRFNLIFTLKLLYWYVHVKSTPSRLVDIWLALASSFDSSRYVCKLLNTNKQIMKIKQLYFFILLSDLKQPREVYALFHTYWLWTLQILGRGQRRQYNLKRIQQSAVVERQDQSFAGLDLRNSVSSPQSAGKMLSFLNNGSD